MLYIWWSGAVVTWAVLLLLMVTPVAMSQYRVQALIRITQAVTIVATTMCFSQAYHPAIAGMLSILGVLGVMVGAHSQWIRTRLQPFGQRIYHQLVKMTRQYPILDMVSDTRTVGDKVTISSADELQAIIRSTHALPKGHREKVANYIGLLDLTVEDAMHSLEDIVSIAQDDVIGPLLLHDLHVSGQQTFVVLDKSETIQGTIALSQLTESSKDVTKVSDIMNRHMVELSTSMSIHDAFQILAREQSWLGVVSDAKTPSVFLLRDTVDALLGKVQR